MADPAARFLFRGGRFLDPVKGALLDGVEVLTEGERVKEVSDRPIKAPGATVIDVKGHAVMPGLIDCHVHIFLAEVDIRRLEDVPLTRMAFIGQGLMRAMLERGFTTVRDTAGADFGIRDAVEAGEAVGPRLSICGRAIGPTGGHNDMRRRTNAFELCGCCSGLGISGRIADGVSAVLEAVRDELRKGAEFIKIMASGGVASPNDPLEGVQFTRAEVEAIVEEATNWGRYVAAHAYGADAVSRAVEVGVRTIEHGNLIDEPTAALMARKGAFLVPTLVTYESMKRRAREFGMSEVSLAKNDRVFAAGLRSVEIAKRAGVEIAFGTDLLGQLQTDQCREFQIRGEVMTAAEIIRSATVTAAKLLRREGELGQLMPGAYADLLVVDGDPLKDLGLWQDKGPAIAAIMKGGRFFRNRLA